MVIKYNKIKSNKIRSAKNLQYDKKSKDFKNINK